MDKGLQLQGLNLEFRTQQFEVDLSLLALSGNLQEIVSGELTATEGQTLHLALAPYEVRWLVG